MESRKEERETKQFTYTSIVGIMNMLGVNLTHGLSPISVVHL